MIKQQVGQKELENIQFGERKKTLESFKDVAKECSEKETVIVKETGTIREKPPAVHWNNRKRYLRARLPTKGSNL